jgi:hypothetical protein
MAQSTASFSALRSETAPQTWMIASTDPRLFNPNIATVQGDSTSDLSRKKTLDEGQLGIMSKESVERSPQDS